MQDSCLTLVWPSRHLPAACHTNPRTAPIPSRSFGSNRIVAPVSTVLFVPVVWKDKPYEYDGRQVERMDPPSGKHWTDSPAQGSIAILQGPPGQNVAFLGDIVAARLKVRGVRGAVIDGRSRDVVSCGKICEDGGFHVWTKGLSSVGTSLEAKPWAFDEPLIIGELVVKPGDILCADEGEKVISVIPRDRLEEIADLLPILKEADDGVLKDAQNGVDLETSFKNHPKHYSNH